MTQRPQYLSVLEAVINALINTTISDIAPVTTRIQLLLTEY